jgi:hypothetical protein
MKSYRQDGWTDAEMLEALYLRDHKGRTTSQIGKTLNRTKNSVCGMLHRIDKTAEKDDDTRHLHGTMGPRWWVKGITAQMRTS